MAAQWGGYRWDEFEALEGDDQAWVVATFRASRQIEAVVAWETSKEARHK